MGMHVICIFSPKGCRQYPAIAILIEPIANIWSPDTQSTLTYRSDALFIM